ncbi:MAG TPA: helix-turn-helix transcriptional regulator [Gammaproteobacteria bacterium]|nr:helix-turn-helix transcriptional regulator [Gammaproteobacteria bacterium]
MAKTIKRVSLPAQTTVTPTLLGLYVRAKRTQLGLTIEEAAAFCGVAKDTLMKVEHGHDKTQLASVLQICKGLGIQLEVISQEQDHVWV